MTEALVKQHMQKSIAGEILRFHVLANSDSEADQNVKKQVRDAVGAYICLLYTSRQRLWSRQRPVLIRYQMLYSQTQQMQRKHQQQVRSFQPVSYTHLDVYKRQIS